MDAAVAALIGAGIGAVVPSATALVAGFMSRRDTREARLFDHRRAAYAAFLKQARSSLDAASDFYWGPGSTSGPEPPEDALVPLDNARADVSIWCSAEADALASEVLGAVYRFTFEKDSTANYEAADSAIKKFVARGRKDLGVPRR